MIVSTLSVLSSLADPTRLALYGGKNNLFAKTLCPSSYTVTVAFFGIRMECRGLLHLVSCTVSPASPMNLPNPWHFPENVTRMLSASKWNAWVMVLSWIDERHSISTLSAFSHNATGRRVLKKKKNSKLSLNNKSRHTYTHRHFLPQQH